MASFPVDHPLTEALSARNYLAPTAVQAAVLDAEAAGRDLLVSARTGSGKTVAYGLAIAETLLAGSDRFAQADAPLALIVAPTRELALQVQAELTWLYAGVGGQIVSCVGGMDPRAEQRALARGAHIVVGTPGRLRDHLERGRLRIEGLAALVLDEADEMLDLGFREDLEFILEATPAERRTLLFSATLPPSIVQMARRFQRDALRLAVAGDGQGHADIEYRAILCTDPRPAVVNLLRFVDSPTTMIFCNTRDAVREMQMMLMEKGFQTVALSGELGQTERNHALQALRDGLARVCVATDVAARGIDLPNLDLVIHAELPQNAETMQHRSGRTGRAGRKGASVLLVAPSRRRRLMQLLATAHVSATWENAPSAMDIRTRDAERLMEDAAIFNPAGPDEADLTQQLLRRFDAEQLAAAVLRLHKSRFAEPYEIAPVDARGPRSQAGERSERGSYERGERSERGERPSRHASSDRPTRWFRINVGRQKNADPRWLIPMLCRQGKITKQDIGAIRIFDRETRFEIDERTADNFLAAVSSQERPEGRIEPVSEPRPAPIEGAAQHRAPRSNGPRHENAARPGWRDKAPKRAKSH